MANDHDFFKKGTRMLLNSVHPMKKKTIVEYMKQLLKQYFLRLGYDIKKINGDREKEEDLLFHFLQQAQSESCDINEWLETTQGWPASLPILELLFFPYLLDDAVVCDIGSGVGRQARHIARRPSIKELYLIENSAWKAHFLQEYFQTNPKVIVHYTDGRSLTCLQNLSVDAIFSGGCFIALPLRTFQSYADECFRVLKHGGICVINYLDIETEQGWKHFKTRGCACGGECFYYHAGQTVDKIFIHAGFECVIHHVVDDSLSTYLTMRKP